MSEGVGYPQAVLAGADGKSPAIDQITGQPLTMEMLLRRRGLLSSNGSFNLMQQMQGGVDGQQQQAAPVQQGGVSGAAGGAAVGGVRSGNSVGAATGATSTAGKIPPEVAQLLTEDELAEAESISILQAMGVGGAVGLGYWLMNKLQQKGVPAGQAAAMTENIDRDLYGTSLGDDLPPNQPPGGVPAVRQQPGMPVAQEGMVVEDMGVPPKAPGQVVDGEFSVVNALEAPRQGLPAPAQQLTTGQPAAIGASPEASVAGAMANRKMKRMAAGGKKGRAAQGSRGQGVIEQGGPVATPAADRRGEATRAALARRKAEAARTRKATPKPKVSPVTRRVVR